MDELLTAATVGPYAVERGLFPPGEEIAVTELGGGVSNVVLGLRAPSGGCVVKQALPRLRVTEEWLAPRERALAEAAALRLFSTLTPGAVPAVLDVDDDACALAVELAPAAWRPWKTDLLAGDADPEIAARLGEVLATWHRATAARDPGIGSVDAFDALRVDPYLRTTAARRPECASRLEAWAERLLSNSVCLVHGDYSPKNVLAGPGGLWVIDAEVAHRGDPVFDLAFLLSHLALKTVCRPASTSAYRACAEAFVSAYGDAPLGDVLELTGCLVLARVDGKSPVEYLDEDGRTAARDAGRAIVLGTPRTVAAAWEMLPG